MNLESLSTFEELYVFWLTPTENTSHFWGPWIAAQSQGVHVRNQALSQRLWFPPTDLQLPVIFPHITVTSFQILFHEKAGWLRRRALSFILLVREYSGCTSWSHLWKWLQTVKQNILKLNSTIYEIHKWEKHIIIRLAYPEMHSWLCICKSVKIIHNCNRKKWEKII